MMNRKPNILYIHSHDTGRYISPHGHNFKTPNIQKLAEDGVLFKQNFCINPTCSPSRAALLTGSYPHQNGMLGLAHRGFSLNNYDEHIVNFLKKHGYHTVLSGVQHEALWEGEQKGWEVIGYDECIGNDDEAHTAAVKFLKTADKEKPLFLSVGFIETHREFPDLNADICDPRYVKPPMPMPDTPEIREDMARYGVSVNILDDKIGAVLAALDESGLAENTLVICTTDHGLAFPDMKCNLNDEGIGVFMILRGPKGFNGGQVIDAMTSHLDVFPTVCELLGVEKPETLEGKSLIPLVNGETNLHDQLFFQVNYHASEEPVRAVRTDRYKYIRRFTSHNNRLVANCDDGESKDYLLKHSWGTISIQDEQLYDLIIDPAERNNLATKPQYADILEAMRNRLTIWMDEKNDPLCAGELVPPKGALVNPDSHHSPKQKPHVLG